MNTDYNLGSNSRMTDSLERDLLAQAIEDQFQPHPLRALGQMVNRVSSLVAAIRAKTTVFDREMI